MAVFTIRTDGLEEFLKKNGNAKAVMSSRTKLWRPIGEMMKRHVKHTFRNQRDPETRTPWKPLKPRTIARRRKGVGAGSPKILMDNGQLLQSIAGAQPVVTDHSVSIGTDKIYAPTHQYGDKRRNIPRRRFLGLGARGRQDIREFAAKVIMKEYK